MLLSIYNLLPSMLQTDLGMFCVGFGLLIVCWHFFNELTRVL